MFQKRPPTIIVAICLVLFILIVLSLWVRQESTLYQEIVVYNREMINFQSKCFKIKSRERIEHKTCQSGFISLHNKCLPCPEATFSLPQWTSCTIYLSCDDMQVAVRPLALLWEEERWQWFMGEWSNFQVLLAQLKERPDQGSSSMKEIITAMQELTPHSNLLYPIGFCTSTGMIVFGMAEQANHLTDLDTLLSKLGCNHWVVRFKLMIDYARVLNYLHQHPTGPYILCNSHSIDHLLSQFIVSEHLELLLANFDNLPRNELPVVCSRQELKGDFVAPEQKWPYSGLKMFNVDEQPGYFYSSDIWKVPDVANAIMGNSKESQKVLNYLLALHLKCKNRNHLHRPSAKEVLSEYEDLWQNLVGNKLLFSDSTNTHIRLV